MYVTPTHTTVLIQNIFVTSRGFLFPFSIIPNPSTQQLSSPFCPWSVELSFLDSPVNRALQIVCFAWFLLLSNFPSFFPSPQGFEARTLCTLLCAALLLFLIHEAGFKCSTLPKNLPCRAHSPYTCHPSASAF